MADYIDNDILCQAYLHVEVDSAMTPAQLQTIKEMLESYATSRARFFIYPQVSVQVEFRPGSLKTYVTIGGSIYAAIAAYGNFRTGVDYLYTDVKRLADSIVGESLFATKARHENILRTEARTGIVGTLKLLIDEMERLEASIGNIPVKEAADRLIRIKDDAKTLLDTVRSIDDIERIENELSEWAANRPARCPHPVDAPPNPTDLLLYNDALTELRKAYPKKKPVAPIPEP